MINLNKMKEILLLRLEHPYESLESLGLHDTMRADYKNYITGMHRFKTKVCEGYSRHNIFRL